MTDITRTTKTVVRGDPIPRPVWFASGDSKHARDGVQQIERNLVNDQETLYVLLTPQQILDDLSYRRGYMVWLDYEQDQLGQPSGIVGEGELIAVFRDIVEAQSWCESHPYPYYHYWWTPVAIGSPDALAWLTAKTAGIATDTDWWIARAKRYTGETADSIDWRSDGF